MRGQFQLVLLLVVVMVAVCARATTDPSNLKDVMKDDEKPLKRAQDPRFNKMIQLQPRGNSLDAASTKKNSKSSTEKSLAKDESSKICGKNLINYHN